MKLFDLLDSNEYQTPLWFYQLLDRRFHFQLDPCTTKDNPLGAPRFFTKEDDGLVQDWSPGPAFMNPPYGRKLIEAFVGKAHYESTKGNLVVGLIRHDPSTEWWNMWVRSRAWIEPVPFRIHFTGADGAYNFPSVIVIWSNLHQALYSRASDERKGK